MPAASLLAGPARMDDEVPSGWFDDTAPRYIVEAEGIENTTWQNDACASFAIRVDRDLRVTLWVENPDPDRRDSGADTRFVVAVNDLGALADDDPRYQVVKDELGLNDDTFCVLATDDGRRALVTALSTAIRLRPIVRDAM